MNWLGSTSSLHKEADTGPAAGSISWYLLYGAKTVLGDTANLLAMACMDVPS